IAALLRHISKLVVAGGEVAAERGVAGVRGDERLAEREALVEKIASLGEITARPGRVAEVLVARGERGPVKRALRIDLHELSRELEPGLVLALGDGEIVVRHGEIA